VNTLAVLMPHEFFTALVYVGLVVLVAIMIPVQLAAKWRRHRLKQERIVCRICGYRFLRKEPEAFCPHCQSRNR